MRSGGAQRTSAAALPKGGSGEDVAGVVDAERDAADREHRCSDEGEDPPGSLAQEDRHRDREGGRGVVAGKAGVGGVTGEEVDAVRVGDEGPRPEAPFTEVRDLLLASRNRGGPPHPYP